MADDEFTFSSKNNCGVCPFALLPKAVVANWLKPPFRKRHPVIFWLLLVLVLLLAAGLVKSFFAAGEDVLDGKERIALVRITGPIMNVAPTLEWLRKLENMPDVKGILVRVDSPGGGAAASQEIYSALCRLAAKLPLAVSMGSTAASGGLMVSMAGQRIFANPSTVTGSIGVRMDIPQLQGLAQKLGIGQETLVTAPYKDAASYLHPLAAEDRAYLEKVLMNMHGQFVDIVAKGRNMPKEKAASLANGKIYTGQEALALGLIDELGGMDDAINWLSQKTGVPASRKLLLKKESKARLLEKLLGVAKMAGAYVDALANLAAARGAGDLEKTAGQPIFLY